MLNAFFAACDVEETSVFTDALSFFASFLFSLLFLCEGELREGGEESLIDLLTLGGVLGAVSTAAGLLSLISPSQGRLV